MKCEIESTNTEKYPAVKKTLLFIQRKNEIIISTEDGREIATLSVEIMDDELSEKGKVKPSNSFWVTFSPSGEFLDKNIAAVFSK